MDKTYKNLRKSYIGCSDIGSLILVGCGYNDERDLVLKELHFNEDNDYNAYIIDDPNIKIPEHYTKIAEFGYWMKIYDDDSLVRTFEAKKIEVYRAGMMGCIIRIIN